MALKRSFYETINLTKSIFTVSGFTVISRVFGFVRDILIANFLGAGAIADAFFVAFRFPNLFRRLFAEGAFSAAFVPIFTKLIDEPHRDVAMKFLGQVFSILSLILIVFILIVEISMPWLIYLIAPGFAATSGKIDLAVDLTRIAFPYLFFISLVSLQSGVLNSLGKFGAAAAAPILLNLTLISALLLFSERAENSAYILSWSVSLAGVIQVLWLFLYCKKEGFPIHFRRPKLTDKVRTLGARILPVIFGVGLYQLNLLVGTILASLVSNGAVSYLYYADRITQLPLGVVGVAIGTALLPALSYSISKGDEKEALSSQNWGLEIALLFSVPAAVAFIVIPIPIVTVLFERGAFDQQATLATANAIIAFSLGLPAYILVKVLAPGFFARDDTKTPVRIAAVSMISNILLNLLLMSFWGHVGIAIAASLSAWINAVGLGIVLRNRNFLIISTELKVKTVKIVFVSLLMGISLYYLEKFININSVISQSSKIFGLSLLIGGGLVTFIILAKILGVINRGYFVSDPASKKGA